MKRVIQLLKSLWVRLFAKKQLRPTFHLEYVYESDVKRQNLAEAARIVEDQRSEFVFQGEPLYKTGGHGHSFVWGFYQSYITKSGKAAKHYYTRELWLIENEFYGWLDGEFVVVPRRGYKPLDLSKPIPFPLIKSVLPKLTSTKLFSVQPMSPPTK